MLTINLNDSGLMINQNYWSFPIATSDLCNYLGKFRKTIGEHNYIYTWDDLGCNAYSKDDVYVDDFTLCLIPQKYDHYPKQIFTGNLSFQNKPLIEYYQQHPEQRVPIFQGDTSKALVTNNISAWISSNRNQQIESISFSAYKKPALPQPLPLDSSFEHYQSLWQDWIAAINLHIPDYNNYYNLKEGIQANDISLVQDQFKFDLPPALVNFYKVHNVYWDAVTSAFQFHIRNWDYDLLPFTDIPREWQNLMFLQTEEELDATLIQNFDPKIKALDYTNPLWIPFAEGRNGDYLLMDIDPSKDGKIGQIIELQNESWERCVIAESLEALIKNEIFYLQQDQIDVYDFIKENGQ